MYTKKIYLIGYKSYLQNNLYRFLKKKNLTVIKIPYKKFLKKSVSNCLIVNFSNHENFFKKKYDTKFDRNLRIAKKIKKNNSELYIISTRQVYKPNLNITEKSKLFPINNYSKNNLISENSCKKILKNKLTILRTANVIGYEIRKKRQSMMSLLIKGITTNNVILDQNFNYEKDIIPINFFCKYVYILIKKRFNGLINIGSGISFTLYELYGLLKLNKKLKPIFTKNNKVNDSSFKYDTSYLKKITKFKIKKKDILKEINKIKNEIKKKI